MKSTLKRELKGLEVVKMETNGFSAGGAGVSRAAGWRVAGWTQRAGLGLSVRCSSHVPTRGTIPGPWSAWAPVAANERGCGRVASNGSHPKPRGLRARRRRRGSKSACLSGGVRVRLVAAELGAHCVQCASCVVATTSPSHHLTALEMLTK